MNGIMTHLPAGGGAKGTLCGKPGPLVDTDATCPRCWRRRGALQFAGFYARRFVHPATPTPSDAGPAGIVTALVLVVTVVLVVGIALAVYGPPVY